MKLEVGKCYKARNGDKVGPMGHHTDRVSLLGPWIFDGVYYDDDGSCSSMRDNHPFDLIEEWVDEKDYLKAYEKALDEGFGKKMPMLEVAPHQHKDPAPYEIAAQYKIIVTVTNGDITVTYDGRDQ